MTAVCVLYSSYSCPHSMRARLALLMANIHCELRAVDLLDLPTAVHKVPLLQLPSGKLLDDSFAIAQWASARKPQLELWPAIRVRQQSIENLVRIIDGPFYAALQSYAAASARRDSQVSTYRGDAEIVLAQLEARLARKEYLVGDQETLADIAALPFIHCFTEIDRQWFDASPYRHVQRWLLRYADTLAWQLALRSTPRWRAGAQAVYLSAEGAGRVALA